MNPKGIVEVIVWLEGVFSRHKIDRSYGGAIARNFWAEPRLTIDVDVLIAASARQTRNKFGDS